MKLIIGLLACNDPDYAPRRTLCRETWLTEMPDDIDYVFLIGGHHCTERRGDELWLPCGDRYYDLPSKTKAFCQWVIRETDYTHLWKADDDTYLCVPRFVWWLENRYHDEPYVGNIWQAGKDYASGGAGYVLDRQSASFVAEELNTTRVRYEDVGVGHVMRSHHIPLTIDHRFIAFGNDVRRPLPNNDIISTHRISEELWRNCWELLSVS